MTINEKDQDVINRRETARFLAEGGYTLNDLTEAQKEMARSGKICGDCWLERDNAECVCGGAA